MKIKIVALLTESLKRQDRHEEILEKLAQGQLKLIDEVTGLRTEFHRMNDHLLTKQEKMEDRISRLEDRVFKN